jgi:hypothetical protein
MEKPKSKTLKIKEFDDLVSGHTLKEVSPPDEAKKDLITAGGKSAMTIQQATAKWFKAAKEQNPSKGFLLDAEKLDPAQATGREMLYKGKGKKAKE